MNWRDHLPIHPAAELFPLMSAAELKELADDIKNHGLRVPIVGWARNGHFLLDGRNRLDAMALLGLLYETADHQLGVKKWTGEQWSEQPHWGSALNSFEIHNFYHGDPYEIALSLNVHRRHLTPEQKRELIAKVLKARPEASNRQIAEQVKADDKTVAKVRTELEATAEFPQLKKTTGKDGKSRPASKPKPAISKPAEPSVEDSAAARRAYYAATEELADKPEHKASSVNGSKADADDPKKTDERITGWDTPEERWQNSLANLAGEIIAIRAYWTKEFGRWDDFFVPSHIQKLVREAATEFASLATQLTPTAPKISDDLSIPDFMRRGAP